MTAKRAKQPGLKTKILRPGPEGLSPRDLRTCVEAIDRGGLVILPTDTVYGIACSVFRLAAIDAIYTLKGRHYNKPLPVLLSGSEQLSLVTVDAPREIGALIRGFWPGPLTLVLKTAPMAMHAARGRPTLAVRVPDHPIARQVLVSAGVPIAATSANKSGGRSMTDGQQVVAAFNGKVDVIIDAGPCAIGRESSVVDASSFPFTIIREGAVPKSELACRLGLC